MGNRALQPGKPPRLWNPNLDKRILFIKDKSSDIVGFIYLFISSRAGVRSCLGEGEQQLGIAGAEPRSPVPDLTTLG